MSTYPKPTHNAALLAVASADLAVEEWPGASHNPVVLAYFEASGHGWVKDDETPWCAAFVNAKLAELGLPGTNSLAARSFEDYGVEVPLSEVLPGDIVVFWRKSPDSGFGHVGFVASIENGKIHVLGGNQGNRVSVEEYGFDRFICFRRATGIPAANANGRPTLKPGSRGAFVADLQDQLHELRYFLGKIDGHFGPITKEAVVAFQVDHDLVADGIVGPKTWDTLEFASAKPDRDVNLDDLRDSGSRTVATADSAETAVKTGAGAVIGLGTVDTVLDATERVSGAQGTLDAAQQVLLNNWPILAVIAVGLIGYFWGGAIMSKFREIRLDDAKTGANLKR